MLTIHTFVVALWNVGSRTRKFAFGIVAVITVFVGLWVGIGNGTHKHYETPTPVRISGFLLLRLIADIVWPVLVLDRSWVQSGTLSWGIYMALGHSVCLGDHECLSLFQGRPLSPPSEDALVSFSLSVVNIVHKLSSYPIAYAILILPTTIARWSEFNHKNVSSAAVLFCLCVFYLSGVTNVLLFLIIRPQLLLFTPPEDYREPEGTVDIVQPTTEISTDAEKNRISRTTGTDTVDDGEWEPPVVGNGVTVTLSRIESDI